MASVVFPAPGTEKVAPIGSLDNFDTFLNCWSVRVRLKFRDERKSLISILVKDGFSSMSVISFLFLIESSSRIFAFSEKYRQFAILENYTSLGYLEDKQFIYSWGALKMISYKVWLLFNIFPARIY